jgi:hypothetical protein
VTVLQWFNVMVICYLATRPQPLHKPIMIKGYYQNELYGILQQHILLQKFIPLKKTSYVTMNVLERNKKR